MESINDRYCRSLRDRDAVARNATSRMALEADVFIPEKLRGRIQPLNGR